MTPTTMERPTGHPKCDCRECTCRNTDVCMDTCDCDECYMDCFQKNSW